MKETVASLIFVIILAFSTLFLPVSGTAHTMHQIPSTGEISYSTLSWLHTDGRWIKDESGNIIILRGTARGSLCWTGWPPWGEHEVEADYDLLKQSGANIVRLCLNSKYYESFPGYVELIDQIIEWCKAKQIRVLLDLHTLTDPSAATERYKWDSIHDPDWKDWWISWWTSLAQKYLNESTVSVFGLFNEPPWTLEGSKTEFVELWRNMVLECCQAIHAVNPNVLISVPAIEDSMYLQMWDGNPLSEPNVIYAYHRYYHYDIIYHRHPYVDAYETGDFETAKLLMEEYYNQSFFFMNNQNLPIWLEEYGALSDDPYYLEQLGDLLDLMNKHEVGFCQWDFSGHNWPMLTQDWAGLNDIGNAWSNKCKA